MRGSQRALLWFCILFLLALIVLVCEGCCGKSQSEATKTVVSTDVVQVKLPVACQFPKVACDFGGDGFVPTEKLLDCIIIQKRLMEKCSLENNTTAE